MRTRRVTAAVAVAGLLVAGLLSVPAQATVSGTVITGTNYPAAYNLITYGQGRPAPSGLLLTGSYHAASSGDTVDSVCYTDANTNYEKLGTSDPVTGGSFRVSGYLPAQLCDLRAVPTPSTGSSEPSGTSAVAGFQPRRVGFGQLAEIGGDPQSVNGSLTVGYTSVSPQAGGSTSINPLIGLGSGGFSQITDKTLASTGVSGIPYIPTEGTGAPGAQGGIRVDGVNGLSLSDLESVWAGDHNQPSFGDQGLRISGTTDPVTGDTVLVANEPVLRCGDDSLPPTQAKCASVGPTGVTVTRTVTTSHDGRLVRYTDSFASPTQRSISLDYEHGVQSDGAGGPEFGTSQGSYATGVAGAAGPRPQAPATVYFKTSHNPTTFSEPAGSVTYSTTPDSTTFDDGGNTYVTHYDRNIPAGGALTLTHTYAISDSDSEVASLSDIARTAGLAPAISLKPLLPVYTNRHVTVAGTISPGQNGLPQSVAGPGGATAPVDQQTGAFTLPVVLTPGQQTVVVMSVDSTGAVSSATVATSYADPLSLGKVKTGLVKGKRAVTSVLRGHRVRHTVTYVRSVRALVTVSCAAFVTAPCAGRVSLTNAQGATIGFASASPSPRRSKTVAVTLSRAGYTAYLAAHFPNPTRKRPHPRAKAYQVTVQLTYLDPDGSAYPVLGSKTAGL